MIYTHIFLPTSPAISAWCCWWKEVKCNTERSFYYLWKQLLVMQIFFLSYQKIKNSLMRRSTFANILCSVVGGAQIPAVLAAGPSSVIFLWQTLPGSPWAPCSWHRGAGGSREGISWGEMDDGQQQHREREREEQRRIQSLDLGWEVGEEGDCAEEQKDFPLSFWTLELETPRALWIYAFTDHCGPDFEIKLAVEL